MLNKFVVVVVVVVVERLISTMNVNLVNLQPEQNLWKINCITYSVAVAWKDVSSEIKGNPSITQRKDKELTVIEKKIVQTRQLLSKMSAEREAMQKQTKMTKRRVKKRKQISVECKSLSVKDLTEFIDKLKHRLKNLARRNKQQKPNDYRGNGTIPSKANRVRFTNA